jgi:large exoprotein involved in heme utilization and adhesion
MKSGDTISAIGRNINISGANITVGNIVTASTNGNGGAINITATSGNITGSGILSYSNAKGENISIFSSNGNITLDTLNSSGGSGNGGNISVSSPNGNFKISAIDSSSTSGSGGEISVFTSGKIELGLITSSFSGGAVVGNGGNGGNISISSIFGDIVLGSGYLQTTTDSNSGKSGNAGNITISSTYGNISLPPNLYLNSYSDSGIAGNGGSISVSSSFGNIIAPNSSVYSFSYSDSGNSGNGGNISFAAKNGAIDFGNTNTSLESFTFSPLGEAGFGGDISLVAKNMIANVTTRSISSSSSARGGDVQIAGIDDLTISNAQILTGGQLQVKVQSPVNKTINIDFNKQGISGNIYITNPSNITINNSLFQSDTKGKQVAGNVTIIGSGLVTFNNSQVTSGTSSTGRAGNIEVKGGQGVTIQGNSQISAITTGIVNNSGKAGDITITTPVLSVQGGSKISAETSGAGTGGDITINTLTSVDLQRVNGISPVLSVETSNSGKAGNILINTPILSLSNGAEITATATKTATNTDGGGSITLNASTMNLFGTVGIFAETQGVAPAGILKLNPYSNESNLNIALANNSAISASTIASGNGGDLILAAPQAITITGNGKLAVETSGKGKAGNISFTTSQLTLTDGVTVSASTTGLGKAGDISVKANNFTISNGARILTTTSNKGDSGNITVNVVDNFTLDGDNTGLFAKTNTGSSGKGGSIFVDPAFVLIQNSAAISVNSDGTGLGGNIFLTADRLTLNNNASISAITKSSDGGNINLTVPTLLLMRYASLISATAGDNINGGNGGNINITSQFVVANRFENSDITANAFKGDGGLVSITAYGIFGLEFRPQLTPFSDITASSALGRSGIVTLNTPNIDPSRGLTTLPLNLADQSRQVNQSCAIGGKLSKRDNSFTISGKGGLPKSPTDELSNTQSLVELVNPVSSNPNQASINEQMQNVTAKAPTAIVEANNIIRDINGFIRVVAASTPLSPAIPQLSCQ